MDISEDSHVLLEQITILSQEFGTSDFVRGGGGNTSVKNETIAWVKPSGTTLSDMTTDTFVALDRQKISGLYQIDTPAEPSQREALVKDVMAEAVISENKARPSVEAPLHDSFDFRFVVHTHPAIVNGMTCAKNGRKICADLFPDSLWIDYIDPGYTLCMVVREKIKDYQKQYSKQPDMVFLENHGVFVAADSAEKIRKLYSNIMSTLKEQYAKAGINTSLKIPPVGDPEKAEKIADQIKRVSGNDKKCFVDYCSQINISQGPLSPDHVVYSKSYPFIGQPTEQATKAFEKEKGYFPAVIKCDDIVFGTGTSEKAAFLALELAKDGALVEQLAEAFGGVQYMTDQAREFIENWEVESYRKTQI